MLEKVWKNIVQVDEFPELGVSIQWTFLESLGDGWHSQAERSASQQLRRGRERALRGGHSRDPKRMCRMNAVAVVTEVSYSLGTDQLKSRHSCPQRRGWAPGLVCA